MKIALESAVVLGDMRVAALVRQSIHQHAFGHYLAVSADKRALALLVQRGAQLTTFSPAGEPMAVDEVERLCPGAMTQFLSGQPCCEPPGS